MILTILFLTIHLLILIASYTSSRVNILFFTNNVNAPTNSSLSVFSIRFTSSIICFVVLSVSPYTFTSYGYSPCFLHLFILSYGISIGITSMIASCPLSESIFNHPNLVAICIGALSRPSFIKYCIAPAQN